MYLIKKKKILLLKKRKSQFDIQKYDLTRCEKVVAGAGSVKSSAGTKIA